MKLLLAGRAFDNMAGGVERQAITLLNEMATRGHQVYLLTWDVEGAQTFYELDSRVTWYRLNMGDAKQKAGWKLRLKRANKVRLIVKKIRPDVILAFQQGTFLSMSIYLLGMATPIIAAERESPYRYDFIRDGRFKDVIFQTFRLASHMVVQCESYVDAYPSYLRHKITVIPNPVFPAESLANAASDNGSQKTLLCVARLGFAKNQSVLIRAFSRIASKFPEWS